jgi:TetR/AcrR family transcriptional regulator, transcriptional repressor for nem operon
MPRAIEFEVEPTLGAVMNVFRRQGFGGTSIKNLEHATGLSSGSLYNSFGDKNAIFAAALSHYTKAVVAGRIAEHLAGRPPMQGLPRYFLSLLDERDGGSSGCLLTNSAIEFGPNDGFAKDALQAGFRLQKEALLKVVNEIFPGAQDAPEKALKLFALYQGILVLIRFGHSKADLHAMIINELNLLKGSEND